MAASLAVMPPKNHRQSSALDTSIAHWKTTYTSTQRNRAVKLLSPTLPDGFLDYFKPRRYGRNWGIPNICPRCKRTAVDLIEEEGLNPAYITDRRRYLMCHLAVKH
jgi:hypothetical protein